MTTDITDAVTAKTKTTHHRLTVGFAITLTVIFLLALTIPSGHLVIGINTYLPLHTTAEIYAVTVAIMVFALGWTTSKETDGGKSLYLALGFLAVGLLDFGHALSYPGMPNFVTPGSAEKAINFWLMARLTVALLLLTMVILPRVTQIHIRQRYLYLWITLAYVGLCYWIILYQPHWLPNTYTPDKGLTTFKVGTEVSIFIIYVITALLLWGQINHKPANGMHWLACGVWIMALSELFFTQYTAVTDWFNLLGHLYKVIAYGIVYYALFVQNVKRPYLRLHETSDDLQLSQARYAAVVSAAMDAIIMIDKAQKIRLFNTAAERMFGYKTEEVIGQPIDILIPESFRKEHAALIRQYASTGATVRQMGRFGHVSGVRKDGVDFPAEASISSASASGNQYFIVNVRDLTQQKIAQETIRLSEQRFQTLISNLQGVVYRCELTTPWRVSFISEGTMALTGYPADVFLKQEGGINWAELVHPDDLAIVDETVNKAVEDASHYEVQYRIRHKDGSLRWVQEKGVAVYDGNQPLYLDGFIHNITEQKRAEEEQLLLKNTAIENSINAVALANLQGELTYVNQAFLDMWGYENKEQVLKRQATDFWVKPEEAANVVAELTRNGCYSGYLRGKKRNGQEFITQLASSIVHDSAGNPSHMFGSFIDVTDRFVAEQQLHTSYQLLDAVFDTTHVLIAVLDPDLNFIRVNRAYAAADGKTPEDFIGKNHFALYPNTDNEAIFRNVVRSGKSVVVSAKPFEYENNPERGKTHWDWTLTPIKDEKGNVTSLVLSLLDVSERINAIEDLNQRRQELRALTETLEEKVRLRTNELAAINEFTEAIFNTVGALIVVLDRKGRIVRFNHACEQVSGYTADEALGRCVWDFLLAPEERDSVREVFLSLTAGHFPNTHENYWLNKNGQRRWINWTNSALTDTSGNVDYVIATGVDVTDRRQAETNLRQSEQQFRLLAENINDVFWLTSPDRKTLYYISPAYETVWGRPCAELYLNPGSFLDAVPEEDRAVLIADHQQQIKGEFKDYYEREFRITRPDGTLRWIKSRYSPITNEKGKVYRVAGISEDITEQKLAQDKRLEQERLQRDALVREVHHRIKNNLQGVLGLLRQHTREKPEIQPAMDTAITQVSTMALVHGLQSTNQDERIMLPQLCDAIARSITGMTGKPIEVNPSPELPENIQIAPDEAVPLALIINELVFNAVKHADQTDKITTLDIQRNHDGIWITIANPCTDWPHEVDIMNSKNLGTGLSLVRALLPSQMRVDISHRGGWAYTQIWVSAPIVELLNHGIDSTDSPAP